jgi:hypothetical protein
LRSNKKIYLAPVVETARELQEMSATAESLLDELAYLGKLLHAGGSDTNGDLEANPDIAAMRFGPRQRYLTHGEVDSRIQAINGIGIQSLCESELSRFLFCDGSPDEQAYSQPIHDLPEDVASEFEMLGSPPVLAYSSLTPIVEPTCNHPDQLPLSAGMLSIQTCVLPSPRT